MYLNLYCICIDTTKSNFDQILILCIVSPTPLLLYFFFVLFCTMFPQIVQTILRKNSIQHIHDCHLQILVLYFYYMS